MRTIVELPDSLVKELDKVLKKKKLSRAEAIRRATEKWLKENREDTFLNAFGVLKDNPISDEEIVELRREWEK